MRNRKFTKIWILVKNCLTINLNLVLEVYLIAKIQFREKHQKNIEKCDFNRFAVDLEFQFQRQSIQRVKKPWGDWILVEKHDLNLLNGNWKVIIWLV